MSTEHDMYVKVQELEAEVERLKAEVERLKASPEWSLEWPMDPGPYWVVGLADRPVYIDVVAIGKQRCYITATDTQLDWFIHKGKVAFTPAIFPDATDGIALLEEVSHG